MELLEETLEIIQLVEEQTGVRVRYEPDEALTVEGTWRCERNRHWIRYHPRWQKYLDHIIAHEAGHIFRVWREDPDRYYLPASSSKTRAKAFRDLEPDYRELLRKGLPIYAIESSADFIYQGAIEQLTNVPIDIRIEEWIHRNFKSLRPVQRGSLMEDVKERYVSLHRVIQETNPRRIYRANQVLNAAWVEFVARLLADRQLALPYRGTRYRTLGKRLFRHLQSQEDHGAPGDREEVDYWARELGMEGWYEWARVMK